MDWSATLTPARMCAHMSCRQVASSSSTQVTTQTYQRAAGATTSELLSGTGQASSATTRQRNRRSSHNTCTCHGGSGQRSLACGTFCYAPLENRDPSSKEAGATVWKHGEFDPETEMNQIGVTSVALRPTTNHPRQDC